LLDSLLQECSSSKRSVNTKLASRGFSSFRSSVRRKLSQHGRRSPPPSPREEKQLDSMEDCDKVKESGNEWRSVLSRLNSTVKEVKDTKVAVKKKDEEEEEEEKEITTKGEGSVLDSGKDVVDLVNECRRARVREQCARLQPRVVLTDKAPSWRDRMAGMVGPSRSVLTKNLKPKVTVEEPVRKWTAEPLRKKSSTYPVNFDLENITIVDKVRPIEENVAESYLDFFSSSMLRRMAMFKLLPKPLMITYIDEQAQNQKADEVVDEPAEEPIMGAPQTHDEEEVKRKQSKWEQIIDTVKKTAEKLPGRHKARPTVDWREEMKIRDKAKQMEGLVQGIPEYKEPEKLAKWEKSGKIWERKCDSTKRKKGEKVAQTPDPPLVTLKPTNRAPKEILKKEEDEKQEDLSKGTFKINLRPVAQRFNSWRGKKTFEKSPDSNPATASKKTEPDPTPAWKKQKKKAGDAQSRTNSTETKKKDNWQEESPACPKKTETMLITTNRNRDGELPKMSVIPTVEDTSNEPKGMHKLKRSRSLGGIPQKRTEKYVIKIINFVAIKVLVEEEEEVFTEEEVEEITPRRDPSQRKVSPERTPPRLPSPQLPEEAFLPQGPDFELSPLLPSSRGELETANARITVQPPAPMNLPLRGVKPEVLQAEVKRKISPCYAPKRKVILEEFPDEVCPRRRIRPEVTVTPFKLSSQKENCVTRALLKDYTNRT